MMAEQVLTPPLYSHMPEDAAVRVADIVVGAHEQAAAIRAELARGAP